MNLAQKLLTRVVLPLLLVLIGAGCVGIMAIFSPTAENAEPTEEAVPVKVMVAQPDTHQVKLSLMGQVEAERQVSLSAEVTGRVQSLAKGLRPGRIFEKGETILQIDSRDYRAALAAEIARLRSAELDLAVEENRQKTAAREVELVGGTDANSLALRKPHLERAKANLEATRQSEKKASLNVERTRLRAPFNGVVVSESVDVGQWIGPGNPVVQLVGTDAVRVTASLPIEQLAHVVLPKEEGERGASVTVVQQLAGAEAIERTGWVTGVGGALEPKTRTASLVMTIPDPYGADGPPLLPGAFVSVWVNGVEVSDVYAVPHRAVIQNRRVWVEANGVLAEREVVVGWRSPEQSFLTSGLEPGDRIITTNLSLPVMGMKVKSHEC